MAAPPSSSSRLLQIMLQAAVQSVHWTYCLFWQLCPQQKVLVWGDGYYNGAIKTRKTVQPTMEFTAEEASLERSQQLRELYESLLAGDANGTPPAKRPCAALSPEDLTETEWFYLMCVSFSFPPGSGLPGKAYTRRKHEWLSGANEVDSSTFSRTILAKSANVQTVVCIPLLDGVVELGTIDKVEEDLGFINHIKRFFTNQIQLPPKPALSEHSTSNPAAVAVSSASPPPLLPLHPSVASCNQQEEEEEDDGDDDAEGVNMVGMHGEDPGGAAELMQVEMSEDIRVGSPDDVSNSIDDESGFNVLRTAGAGSIGGRRESSRKWLGIVHRSSAPQPTPSSAEMEVSIEEDDTHYSQTVSSILHSQSVHWADTSSTVAFYAGHSNNSSFATWTNHPDSSACIVDGVAPQRLLRCILFTVPFLHEKPQDDIRPPSDTPAVASQEELSGNHVMAERRRREKINERFVVLRSLVPFVTKMDKASILGDAIEYVKHLKERIEDLESHNNNDSHPIEIERRHNRKIQTAETAAAAAVEVSIIESDALLEMKCGYREGLLLDVLQMLRELRMETTAVQTAVNGGVFVAEIRAKVKESRNGKKPSITDVKRAIHQLIQT